MKAITIWDHLRAAATIGYLNPVNPALKFLADPEFNRLVNSIKEKNRNYTNYPHYRGKDWDAKKQTEQDIQEHQDAVNEALQKYELKAMKAHSDIVAKAAEENHKQAFPDAKDDKK